MLEWERLRPPKLINCRCILEPMIKEIEMSSREVEIQNNGIYNKLREIFSMLYEVPERHEKVSVILNHFRHDIRAKENGTETVEELNKQENRMKPDQLLKDQNTDAQAWSKSFMELYLGRHPPVVDESFMISWFAAAIETAKDVGHKEGRQELMSEDTYHPGRSPMVIFRDHIIDDTVPTQNDLSLDQRVAVLPFGDCEKIRFGHVCAIYSKKYSGTVCDVGIHIEGHENKKFIAFDKIRRITPIATRQQLWLILLNDAIDSKSKVELLKSLNKTGLLEIKLPANEEVLSRRSTELDDCRRV